MMDSDDYVLHFIAKEDNKCVECANGRPFDSPRPSRLSNDTQSNNSNKVNNCSKCSCQSRSFHLDYSNDIYSDASRRAGSSDSSSCSEQNDCGSSHNSYSDDFNTDSSETSSRNRSNTPLEQLETREEGLTKQKTGNKRQVKGGKTLHKKKQQQKKTCLNSNSIIHSQKSNNVVHRLLSARLHKVKELKNEVSVLKKKLEASDMENQILKRLQYRHLRAISKYENAEINLPDLMAQQCTEVKILRVHLRRSQEQERSASRKLREVEAQLLKTKDTLQALQKLSEDKNLAERGELQRRLTAFTQRMEASDERIQHLERELQLNNTFFSHQLAAEKKKTLEARLITTNLQKEIKMLNQKIKEKERELGIRNIYANRLLKGQREKADSKPLSKDINVSKSVQVDINIEAMPLQKHETERNVNEELIIKNINEKNEQHDVHKEQRLKRDVHQTEKNPVKEMSNKTDTELLGEETYPIVEKYFRYEHFERQKNRRERQGLDLLKKEFEKLRTEQSLQTTDDILKKENKVEDTAIKNQENEEDRRSAAAKEDGCNKLPTVIQRTPSRFKKYIFTEAVENLHQGFPSTGRLSSTAATCNSSRQVNGHHNGATQFKANDLVSAYEPSFGKNTNAKSKDSTSTCSEDCITSVSVEKKNTLMEELFGPNCLLKDSHPNLNLKEVGTEKDILQNEKSYDEISYMNDSLQCGDSKQAHIKAFYNVALLENLK